MSWVSSPALSLSMNFLIPSLSKMGNSSSLLPPGHFVMFLVQQFGAQQ